MTYQDLELLKANKVIRKSCSASFNLTKNEYLLKFFKLKSKEDIIVKNIAISNQIKLTKNKDLKKRESFRSIPHLLKKNFSLAENPLDFIRIIIGIIILPSSFNDEKSGKDNNLKKAFIKQMNRLKKEFN